MGTPYKNAAGLTPEDVYDPDVVGDGPDAAINGIGYRNAAGVLLRFAALKYGTAAANHGYRLSDGRDFSALWAKKGTAVYLHPTPDYNGLLIVATKPSAQVATVSINLANNGSWSSSDGQNGAWYGTGATPGIGSSYEALVTIGGGDGTTNNPASVWTSVSSGLTVSISSKNTVNRTVQIQIRTAGGAIAADGTATLQIVNDG